MFVWKRRRRGDEEWEDGTPSHFFPRNTAEKGKEDGGGHSRDKKGRKHERESHDFFKETLPVSNRKGGAGGDTEGESLVQC